jgi:tetratricopeptide (TPR) repeat protein
VLFDLRSAGRRRTVKLVYLGLAILMGGGLILFGIGGNLNGGLVDAVTGNGGGGGNGTDRLEQRAQAAQAAVRSNPRDPAAWLALARARAQVAGTGENYDQAQGTYTASGRQVLQRATQAWERYLSLDPRRPDERTARLMVQAYLALNDLQQAVRAQEIIVQASPTSATYTNLALLAYQAGNTRTGDLARREALDRADPDERATLRSQLQQARRQATAPAATPAPAPAGG